jgi:hypothetical protein
MKSKFEHLLQIVFHYTCQFLLFLFQDLHPWQGCWLASTTLKYNYQWEFSNDTIWSAI